MKNIGEEPRARDMFKGKKMNYLMAPKSDFDQVERFEKIVKSWKSKDAPAPDLKFVIKSKAEDAGEKS